MTHTLRTALLALALALVIGLTSAHAAGRRARYIDRRTGNVVVIANRCITAEDSAAHLRLVDYRDAGGFARYTCSRKGY